MITNNGYTSFNENKFQGNMNKYKNLNFFPSPKPFYKNMNFIFNGRPICLTILSEDMMKCVS